MVLYSLAAGGTLIIYLRFFCGWRLGDLMYVTRASLSRSLTSVTAGACLPGPLWGGAQSMVLW